MIRLTSPLMEEKVNGQETSKDNVELEKNQRPIQTVTKAEFIAFNVLLIGASIYSAQRGRLWREDFLHSINSKSKKKQQVGLSG